MELQPIIEIRHLNKTFGEGASRVVALEDIDLTVYQGEIFGIIGLSGAGKSTLVRCINLLETPTEGSVFVNGKNLQLLSRGELIAARRSMSMIFQQFNLLSQRSVLGNVRFPLELSGVDKAAATERARELLAVVGLADKEKAFPAQLSGGQKQRVAIARALASDPRVLLCDEATSALDPTTTAQILELLKRINREMGITIVIITHEMKVIEEVCSRVAIIHHSRIAEVGAVGDIFLHPKTDAARALILPPRTPHAQPLSNACIRLVFDGTQTHEPIVSGMVLACGAGVNIVFADTKTIDGRTYGQMLLQLPADARIAADMRQYLDKNGVRYIEEALA